MRKVLCLIASLFISSNLYAKITAEFTPNPTSPGQTVEFILSSDQPFSGTPNLDILKKDFVIGGQQRRQSAQWVNGKGTNIYQLIYTLFPNKSGSLTVQGLKVGNQSIPAATLKVNTTQQQSDPTRSLSMHIDCPQNTIYPAQKMVCTLYLDDPIGIVDGQIIPPQTNLGTWTQVMQPVAVSSRTDGVKRYQSTFSFTPKQSGKLDMPPFVFQGEARLDTRGKMKYDSLLDFMLLGLQSTATQPVSTQTQPFSLNIKHKPATYQGWWLPSPHTTLTESYQMPDTLGVGEPITRTLTLTAQDVAADDMPVPSIKETDTIKVYANPEQRLDTPEGGQVTVTLTLVPTQPGEISLPAAAVSWFNTTTEKIETASVPERVIFVSGTSSDIQQPSAPVISEKSSDETKATAQPIQNVPQPLPWVWIILSLSFAFVFGIIVAVLILKHSQSTERKKKKPLPDLYPF